jgi:hypothetical protein
LSFFSPLSLQDVDEELIIDECMNFLFAGHDTTGVGGHMFIIGPLFMATVAK